MFDLVSVSVVYIGNEYRKVSGRDTYICKILYNEDWKVILMNEKTQDCYT